MDRRDPEDFERKIYFKENAAWLLAQELRGLKPGTRNRAGNRHRPLSAAGAQAARYAFPA